MSAPWDSIWEGVRYHVRTSTSRAGAVQRVSILRGEATTWDALARAWRRMQDAGRESISADQALGQDTTRSSNVGPPVDVDKWARTGMITNQVARGPKHGVWGDTQICAGDDLRYIEHTALYFADKRPDVVVQLGDWADMVSLSSYDSKAKKAVDQRSVRYDFEAANEAWATVDAIWKREGYNPRKVYLLGNHENRIDRFIADNPEFSGDVNTGRFVAKELGWEVIPFLDVVVIDGVAYSHYFPRGPSGRVTQTKNGAPNAITMIKREMRSCTAGHMQGLDVAIYQTSERTLRGVILGSSYPKEEHYLSQQGNRHWRGVLMKHSVRDGNYDLVEVPLDYLEAKYG